MANNFCSSCGSPLEAGSRFCPGCGAKADDTAPVAAAAPVAVAAKKPVNVKNAVMLGICGVLAVTAIVLLCIILFGGKGNSSKGALTDYTYSDIVGTYSGDGTVTSLKASKDTKAYYREFYGEGADYNEYISNMEDQLNLGRSNRCTVRVSRDSIKVRLGTDYTDIHYFSREYLDLEDVGFTNGYCGETYIVQEFEDDDRKGINKVECDLTLKADERYDYRIVGTLTVIDDLDIYDEDGKHLYDVTRTIVIEIDVTLSEQGISQSGGADSGN